MGPRQGRRRKLDVAWLVGCEREEGGRGGMIGRRGGDEKREGEERGKGERERRERGGRKRGHLKER